jgi:hypothetical protein
MHHLFADLELGFDVPDMSVAPALEEVRRVTEKPVQPGERTDPAQGTVPRLVDHLCKAREPGPN